MLDYLIEWVWEQKEIQEKPVLFGKYIEKEEYSPELDLTFEQKRLVDAIKELGESATPKRIAQELGKTEGAVKMMLGELLDKGVIVKTKRGVYSISKKQKEPYFAYFTDFTYFSDFTYFTYFDTESKEKSDQSSYFQSIENSDFEAKVRKVRKVSLVENPISDPTPAPDLPPTPFDTKPEGTPDKTKEPDEEEVVYLLMPQEKACERCKCEIWVVRKRDYGKRGYGRCAKCGHVSFLWDLTKGRLLNKADVEYFLDLP